MNNSEARILPNSVCISGDGLKGFLSYSTDSIVYKLYNFSVSVENVSISYNSTSILDTSYSILNLMTTYTGDFVYFISNNFAWRFNTLNNTLTQITTTNVAKSVYVTLNNKYILIGLNQNPIQFYLSTNNGSSFTTITTTIANSGLYLRDVFISLDGKKICVLTRDFFYELNPLNNYSVYSTISKTTINIDTDQFINFSVSMNGMHAICVAYDNAQDFNGYLLTQKSVINTNILFNRLDLSHYLIISSPIPNNSDYNTGYKINGVDISKYFQYMDASFNPVIMPYKIANKSICQYFYTY